MVVAQQVGRARQARRSAHGRRSGAQRGLLLAMVATATATVTGACGAGGPSTAGGKLIDEAQSCEALVESAGPAFADSLQALFDRLSALAPEERVAALTAVNPPPELQAVVDEMATNGDVWQKRADQLSCADTTSDHAMCAAFDGVDTHGLPEAAAFRAMLSC